MKEYKYFVVASIDSEFVFDQYTDLEPFDLLTTKTKAIKTAKKLRKYGIFAQVMRVPKNWIKE